MSDATQPPGSTRNPDPFAGIRSRAEQESAAAEPPRAEPAAREIDDASDVDVDVSRQETLAMVRDWLSNDPTLDYRSARKDAERLKLPLTPRLFAEARGLLGIPGGPPRAAVRRDAPRGDAVNEKENAGGTPLMAFVLDYMKAHPACTYGELKAAAESRGFKVAPIVYGNARKTLGMSPKAGPAGARASRGPAGGGRGAQGGAARRERGGSAAVGDLSGVLGRLQDMAAERDRFHDALERIARILDEVL
ncbi:MAG TPA: hypothetical protein VEI02_02850 [Planctomycetota bacterium]|nr:hypothetical protein [Planctomycetota bacterium]